MPELPEVETTARGLRERIVGRRIAAVVGMDWPRMLPNATPTELQAGVAGRTVDQVERRGKYLLLGLSGGPWLVLHRKMSGNVLLRGPDGLLAPHTHLILRFDDRSELHFVDPRKFGRVYLFQDRATLDAWLGARLGPEPLADLTATQLGALLRTRRGRLKPLLLDQRFLAGIGNLYADEILWDARLHPVRSAATLTEDEQARLLESTQRILAQAIRRRGTTFSSYVDATGERGENQDYLQVYGRAGRPCPRCEVPIERHVVAQRGTWLCPSCQPALPTPTTVAAR